MHLRGLALPVLVIILRDAQGVNPDVSQTQAFGQLDGLLEGWAQAHPRYLPRVLVYSRRGRFEHECVLPPMAQRNIVAQWCRCVQSVNKTYAFMSNGFDQPSRQGYGVVMAAVQMLSVLSVLAIREHAAYEVDAYGIIRSRRKMFAQCDTFG